MILEKSQNFTYYAGIMLDAIAILLCSKLCWHNWLKPISSINCSYNYVAVAILFTKLISVID